MMTPTLPERSATRRSSVLEDFLRWLNRRFATDDAPIEDHTRLFAEGRIDSMGILHLIAWVERASGRTIPDRLVRIDYFETPALIIERFLSAPEKEPR